MKKSLLLLAMALVALPVAKAQSPHPAKVATPEEAAAIHDGWQEMQRQWSDYDEPATRRHSAPAAGPSRPAPGPINTDPVPMGTGNDALELERLGNATNAYSIINDRPNQIFVVQGDEIGQTNGVVGFVHRQSNELDPDRGDASELAQNGVLRIDLSTDGGNTFTNDIGPLNPLPYTTATGATINARTRYPQVAPYVPGGATQVNDIRVGFHAPTTDGSGWGNYCRGVAYNLESMPYLDPSAPGSNYAQSGSVLTAGETAVSDNIDFDFLGAAQDNFVFIPGGMTQANGDFYTFDVYFQNFGEAGETLDSLAIWKGSFTGPGEDELSWSKAMVFRPNVHKRPRNQGQRPSNCNYPSGVDLYPVLNSPNMAFSPNGQYGWAFVLGDLEKGDGLFDINPLGWYTDDFGATWQGRDGTMEPIEIDLRTIDNGSIIDTLETFTVDGEKVSNDAAYPLNFDLVVDNNGNPHLFTMIANASDIQDDVTGARKCDSLYFFQPGAAKAMYDLTTYNFGQSWCPKFIAYQTLYNPPISGTDLTFGNRAQASISKGSGSGIEDQKVFFSWVDDPDPTKTSTNARAFLFDVGIDLETGNRTEITLRGDTNNLALAIPGTDPPVFTDQIAYPTVAPEILERADGSYLIPTALLQIISDELSECTFYFVKNRTYTDADFTEAPEVDLAITDIISPTSRLCDESTTNLVFDVTNEGSVAISEFDVVYSVNGGAPVTSTQTVSVAPGATEEITISGIAISGSGTYNFALETITPGDDNCGNNTESVSTLNFGALIETGDAGESSANAIQGCGTVTLDIDLPDLAANTSWSVSDGGAALVDGNNEDVDVNGVLVDVFVDPASKVLTITNDNAQAAAGSFFVEVEEPLCTPSTQTAEIFFEVNPTPQFANDFVALRQACFESGQQLTLAGFDDATYTDYDVVWSKDGQVLNGETGGELVIDHEQGEAEYTLSLTTAAANGGCSEERTIRVIFWDITESLIENFEDLDEVTQGSGTEADPFWVCGSAGMDPRNPSQPNNSGVLYRWLASEYGETGAAAVADSILSDTTRSATRGTLVDSTFADATGDAQIVDAADHPARKYRVEVFAPRVSPFSDTGALLDCGNGQPDAVEEIWVTTWDTVNGVLSGPSEESLCYNDPGNIFRFDPPAPGGNGMTGITGWRWRFAPNLDWTATDVNTGDVYSPTNLAGLGDEVTPGPRELRLEINDRFFNTFLVRVEVFSGACSRGPGTGTEDDPNLELGYEILDSNDSRCGTQATDDASAGVDLVVFPNPSSGQFTLDMASSAAQNVQLRLYNVEGKLIQQRNLGQVSRLTETIDLSDQATGVYNLVVQTDEGVTMRKLIKK